jgi:DNA-directed RNA polymerase specialized sigma24 family protein
MVRDYVATLTDRDTSDDAVEINPDLGGLEEKVNYVRAWTSRVQTESQQAAAASREIVRECRRRGLSVTDTAIVLGVSRGRVSQLSR